MYWAAAFIR